MLSYPANAAELAKTVPAEGGQGVRSIPGAPRREAVSKVQKAS